MKDTNKQEKENQKNIEKIEEVIKNKKKVGVQQSKEIKSKIFENVIIAIVFLLYFYLLYLGSQNIESSVFFTDLKVFAFGILIVAIIIFEISYKKDSGNLCIHGIETLILAIVNLFLVYVYTLEVSKTFTLIIAIISSIYFVYFIIKTVVLCLKMKKKFIKSKDDIKEIVKNK